MHKLRTSATFSAFPLTLLICLAMLGMSLAACQQPVLESTVTPSPASVSASGTEPVVAAPSAPPAGVAGATVTPFFANVPPPSATPVPTSAPTNTVPPTPTAQPSATPTIPPAIIELEGAQLPPGFSMIRYADLFQPTGLTFDNEGNLLATSGDGAIHLFRDLDGDGRADEEVLFAEGFRALQGVAVQPESGLVYASSLGRIDVLQDSDRDRQADSQRNLVQGLPYDWHWNNNPKFGPDGSLYVGIGSTCDVCVEVDPRSATIMRFDPAGGEGEIVATGLRNPFDLAFHPITGALFATDNGRDDLGENEPPEELNHIVAGADYGFPNCWGDNSQPGCAQVQPAVAFFQARSSANSLDFYTGDRFPPAYSGSDDLAIAYVSIFGAWDYDTPVGIARVQLTPAGDSYRAEVDWFAQWTGNPLGLIVGPDGALYAGDYTRGAIFRISYGP